jgi:hypothetical protein
MHRLHKSLWKQSQEREQERVLGQLWVQVQVLPQVQEQQGLVQVEWHHHKVGRLWQVSSCYRDNTGPSNFSKDLMHFANCHWLERW